MYDQRASLYDVVYSGKDYAREAARLHELIRQRHPRATTLLDVACGTGRHLEELREHYEVEGVDLSAPLLAIAARRLSDVPLHEADMRTLDLGKRFDAVTCLFSAIGHMRTVDELNAAIAAMARHLKAGGVLILEPWITPEAYHAGGIYAVMRDEPELKVVRMNISERSGDLAVFVFHWLVGTPEGIQYFTEQHELRLFTDEEYEAAFGSAGLHVQRDAEGLIGRGLYIGSAPV
jgi:ubiquinone/menaquinone biosynthesis C-methylase UbiE